ncbi:MAG TPA: transglutaminase domain-containing protein [Gaiellaceae bacterium]|nr:transglutaminase domain-containing protein [Gaiellaceae bacterium]
MVRTAFLAGGAAAVIAGSWARLEQPRVRLGELVLIAALAVAPALVPTRRLKIPAAVVATLAATSVAFDVSPLVAPHRFVGSLFDRASSGFRDYYDVLLPFDRVAQPEMHGVLLLAVFVFSLAAALAIAARRPALAILAMLAGAAWPATIYPAGDDLVRGIVLLAASLVLLAALRAGPSRPAAQALAGGIVLVLALGLTSSAGAGKRQFVNWENWDFYNRPDNPVTVSYVWRGNYDGVKFPNKRTRVLHVRASSRATYWRATTLDSFSVDRWDEDLTLAFPDERGSLDDLSSEPRMLMPRQARDVDAWDRADVTIDALSDNHLVGASVPVAYDPGKLSGVQYATNGAGVVSGLLSRGDQYTTWGYAPRPKPAQLARSRPDYPVEIAEDGRDLSVDGIAIPPFGATGRQAWLADLFANDAGLRPYRALYERAREIAGRATNPYAATVALEAWFRSGGGFVYDESPRRTRSMPPLVFFVTRSKEGYCQHFGGAMALMLRYLGIPARVAAGFTSGTYDRDRHTWNVSDRNAHTWVEVWFRGFGWLSFDPTPGRGNLSGPYSASSFSFDAPGARAVLAAAGLATADTLLRFQLDRARGGSAAGPGPRDVRRAQGGEGGRGGLSVAQGLVLALAALVLLFAAGKLARRRSRYLTRDPRRLATACRRELVELLADQRIDVPPAATLGELRSLVRDETGVELRRLVSALGLARFGPAAGAPAAARAARAELRAARRSLRRAFSAGARVRGTFSLRSVTAR